jgi:hypothetical protein
VLFNKTKASSTQCLKETSEHIFLNTTDGILALLAFKVFSNASLGSGGLGELRGHNPCLYNHIINDGVLSKPKQLQ